MRPDATFEDALLDLADDPAVCEPRENPLSSLARNVAPQPEHLNMKGDAGIMDDPLDYALDDFGAFVKVPSFFIVHQAPHNRASRSLTYCLMQEWRAIGAREPAEV